MINFPTSLDNSVSLPNPGSGSYTDNPSHYGQHTSENDAIKAIEAKVGISASTPTATGQILRCSASGTTVWGLAVLTTDVTGILPVANGGTGVAASTGTGNAVLSSSPTITTPTIADFTNASHGHTNAAGGGTLNAANALQTGTVSFDNLLSTIFSGKVLTQANAGNAGGTMSYVNLGGIKLLWCISANQTSGALGTNYTFTLPTSFFTTVTMAQANTINQTVAGEQYANVNNVSATTIICKIVSPSGAATAGISLFAMGT